MMAGNAFAQRGSVTKIQFIPEMRSSKLKLGLFYKLENGDSIQVSTLKFYISKFQFLNNDTVVFSEANSFHLIDASDEKSMNLEFKMPININYSKIKFNVGIDSITNFSGAMGGELDPTRGMYWTWQNGYINFKMEGNCNRCVSRNHEFQFHLGGYQYPFNSLQEVTLNVNQNERTVIVMDIEKLISEIDLSSKNEIMSPGKEAMFLSEKVSKTISISKN